MSRDARQLLHDYDKASAVCANHTTAQNALEQIRLRNLLVSHIEVTAMQLARKDEILKRITRTHMHNGHCTWCDSAEHERDCFVAAAIAEVSSSQETK